jgi:hypothetical protein
MKTFLFSFFLISALVSYEVQLQFESGDVATILVDEKASFEEVIESLRACFPCEARVFTLERGSKKGPRNYFGKVSQGDVADVKFIINTLGFAPLAKIAKERSALKKAGNRINYIHPLRFLLLIFQDEKMKVAIHSLRDRGVIWKEFYTGIKDGFDEEINNFKGDAVSDFCGQLSLDCPSISSLIKNADWRSLIDYLIDNIPRDTNHDRYIW